jgi:hypothetical protein
LTKNKIMTVKITQTLLFVFFISIVSNAQTQKVLFIGNSYTGVNNLPQLVYNVAISVGDTLIYDAHTPGGNRLLNHATNATALAKINSNNWDHVVLQAQSQEPSFPIGQVQTEVFPYATILCDSIRANDVCTRPVFYMTWGRENGDASNCAFFPPVCSYEGMDSLLNLRYRMMGNDNDAYVSPVGAVWHYIRDNYPNIDLYSGDGSHPSLAGSYAAACTFYTVLFEKNPTLIQFNSSLSESDANQIKEAAKAVAFDNLSEWNVGSFDPAAEFSFTKNGTEIAFINSSTFADSFLWNFGDGETSTEIEPVHDYQNNNVYTTQLVADNCGISDTFSMELMIQVVATNDLLKSQVRIYPSPTKGLVNIEFELEEMVRVKVTDVNGRVVYQGKNISSPGVQFELRGNAGLYFVQVANKSNTQLYKLIKI